MEYYQVSVSFVVTVDLVFDGRGGNHIKGFRRVSLSLLAMHQRNVFLSSVDIIIFLKNRKFYLCVIYNQSEN